MSFNQALSVPLQSLFSKYAQNDALEVISLATTDGFPVQTLTTMTRSLEEDSLSAAASTLHSVSNAVAQQILGKNFKVAFIEAEQGNVAFVDLDIDESNYVLVMSANESLNIASLRLLITRLATEIEQLSPQTVVASA
ncbi:roadblock/LC7 domain-containing protein [Gilvimarinus sp. SDUM040013]|uniref:Roadblock/LC7 domain-containing protein n=1 Tax=Gilvimarinus gilvus TaxID=3058038 RepID=A0ABU4RZM5_9GAMM|nr:roadblock/LC7 domain-containing protein [Gilvimarinus sp. SDUM040013]MDO3386123.1 roadblock/LC7 domain-containing protein [Gilvimarinus sp. SDUM040013]MDX6850336.1 roadblock/LC7 domain-containing protein [Gilvimarinus sp. SDUM040013]